MSDPAGKATEVAKKTIDVKGIVKNALPKTKEEWIGTGVVSFVLTGLGFLGGFISGSHKKKAATGTPAK